jgi:hypothetical protein
MGIGFGLLNDEMEIVVPYSSDSEACSVTDVSVFKSTSFNLCFFSSIQAISRVSGN